jgi:hypothetical protein
METAKMKIRNKKSRRKALSVGSALILAVVLTSLLAIIGVLFVMASRVNKIATSAISQTRELDLAVDAVVAQIAEQLALDVPRIDPNTFAVLQEYYDYPDEENRWLASLEPYEYTQVGSGVYRWRRLSDVYANIADQRVRDVEPQIIPEYQHPDYVLDSSSGQWAYYADADGDGVRDSLWIELPDVRTSKGWPIYAAIRVIDNGAMLNVNTGFEFDPTEGLERIDGSSQMQINLMALAQPGGALPALGQDMDLLEARANYGAGGINPADLAAYERNAAWRYGEPNGLYTPFDISDELELHYRFLLNQQDIDTRLEMLGPVGRRWGFREYAFGTPVQPADLDEWFITAYGGTILDPNYAYRHIATIYNMDRIIAPDGKKVLNVNTNINPTVDKEALRDRIRAALLYDANPAFIINVKAVAAQMAANLVDFRDEDEIVTAVDDLDGNFYYGFERPCVYISELVHKSIEDANGISHRSYAIELYKPYFEDNDPCGWQLVIDNQPNGIDVSWSGTRRFHVVLFEDSSAPLSVYWTQEDSRSPADGATWVDPEVVLGWPAMGQRGWTRRSSLAGRATSRPKNIVYTWVPVLMMSIMPIKTLTN